MKKFTILLAILLAKEVQAQFRPYSQYHLAPTFTNPANVGMSDYLQVTANYRQSRVSSYEVPSISFIYPFYEKMSGRRYGGMGISVINQSSGPSNMFKTTGALGGFAYDIQLSKRHHLDAGLQLGFINKRIDLSGVTTDSQYGGNGYDPTLPSGETFAKTNSSAVTVNSGLTWYYTDEAENPKAWLGAALYNMNRPNYKFINESNREPVSVVLHGAVLAAQVNNFSILPTFRYIHEAKTNLLNIGSLFEYSINPVKESKLGAGIWYNTNKSLGFNLQYAQEKFLISAGYDASTFFNSDVASVNNAFELALSLRINRKKRVANRQKTTTETTTTETTTTEETKNTVVKEQEKPVEKETPKAEPTPKEEVVKEEAPKETPKEVTPAPKPATPKDSVVTPIETTKPLTAEEKAMFDRKITFAKGGTELSPEDEAYLDSLATILKEHPELKLKISGHTCNIGSKRVNQKVSRQRAEKVKAELLERGVPNKQLISVGYDYQYPIASNKSEEGRIKNRRVELELVK